MISAAAQLGNDHRVVSIRRHDDDIGCDLLKLVQRVREIMMLMDDQPIRPQQINIGRRQPALFQQ